MTEIYNELKKEDDSEVENFAKNILSDEEKMN